MTSEQSTGPSYNTGGIELTACQLHEALLMAGTPELGVPFEDRGRVRIFQSETGHSGPGLYCECVDAEEEGCILLDGTSPAIASPAQAVDLGPVPLIARALAEWHEDDGNVLWWAWCGRNWAGEPAWAGTPNDSDWPGYHTHWTPHPSQPALLDSEAVGK
ncbi:hypothetical protein JAK76_06580 [Stenotrophomonas maltophilia]|uniref:hypothetical protein n=1 Tax=Stenotrophomonas maltophilia TaxID=40324 RepID=UPI001FA75022|nr:hypothetical protein [Stenotrophomonas maltophilia]MCU1008649.1 hypothetical protein [Stenotrophomonas maltophilia]